MSSLAEVQAGLDRRDYDEGYIRYVVAAVLREKAAGRVKTKPGAIYKGIIEGYYAADYHGPATKPAAGPVARPAAADPVGRRPNAAAVRRLQSQLGDAESSLRWLRDEAPEQQYPGPARAEKMAQIEAQIAGLRAQLG